MPVGGGFSGQFSFAIAVSGSRPADQVIEGGLPWDVPFLLGQNGIHAQYGFAVSFGGIFAHYGFTAEFDGNPPFSNVLSHLNAGESAVLQFIGDSTVFGEFDELNQHGWVGRLGVLLGTAYNVSVVIRQWNDTTQAYDAPATLYAGSGSNQILLMNGSKGGKTLAYYDDPTRRPLLLSTPNPDIIIIGDCFNETITPTQFAADYQTFITHARSLCPNAPIIATTENQTIPDTTSRGLNGYSFAARFDAMVAALTDWQPKVTTLDTQQAYPNPPTGLINTGTGLGIHPNAAGYTTQAHWVLNQLAPSLQNA